MKEQLDCRRTELINLERRNDVATILRTHPLIASGDTSLVRRISGIATRNSSNTIVKHWRHLAAQDNGTFYTDPNQVSIISLPTDEILELQGQVDLYNQQTIPEEVEERIAGRVTVIHDWNDEYEILQKQKRSLEVLRNNGCIISIAPEDVEAVRREYTPEAECPVLDKIKNKRIASINGLKRSKVALTIHDLFDHFYTYDTLEKLGILQEYAPFMQSVGNPQDTDMFKREGELIASISFEWRSSHVRPTRINQIMTHSKIEHILGKAQQNGATLNQQRAIAIFTELPQDSDEIIRLESMYSGILVELMEQRRKHGFINQLDQDYTPQGILPLLDPEYLALIIETNHILCNPATNAEQHLFHIETLVENHLIQLATGERTTDLVVTIPTIEQFDPTKSAVSPQRQQWLRENLYHTSNRGSFC
ncbi:MAG: hypothetical protein ACEQSA_03795 [Weeksellaceae bacterium]